MCVVASCRAGCVRGRVARVLAERRVPTMETDNKGLVVVDAKAWRAKPQ